MSAPHEYRARCRRPRLPWQSPGFKIRQKARIMATLFQFNPFHIRGETYMAKIHWALACLLLFVTAAAAQEHYTEGPVWRVTLAKVKPAQMDAYLTSLRQATKPLLEEEKRTGAIVDYKIFLKETNRKSTRLNSSHLVISYAVFCLKKKKQPNSVPILQATSQNAPRSPT